MQFDSGKSRRSKIFRKNFRYSSILQLYEEPPTEKVSLSEFEEYAIDRIKLLKIVENVGLKHVKGSEEYCMAIKKEMANGKLEGLPLRLKDHSIEANLEKVMKKDHVSHFILRLAFCRTEDLRRWFLAQELDLFKLRWSLMTADAQKAFMLENRMHYNPISDSEKSEKLTELTASTFRPSIHKSNTTLALNTDFYKVPFTEAIELVRTRKVYIEKGQAYIPSNEVIVLIQNYFRMKISAALVLTTKTLSLMEEDDRLGPILDACAKRHIGIEYVTRKNIKDGEVTPEMLDQLSKESFPPCMQQLHHNLKTNHHLKHNGRMQYGLFLKGIGLSMNDAIRFWKTEFCKQMDGDKWDKQYLYNIRHNYGHEGKRANYTPYSCSKICSMTPGPGESNGCPFRHTDASVLRQRLQGMSLNREGIDTIVEFSKKGHPQLACGKYFDMVHNQDIGFTPNHPNHYFDESRNVLNPKVVEGQKERPVVKPKLVPTTSKQPLNVKKELENSSFDEDLMTMDME
ncbi:DgyrCDS6581 [Dimorphilus gyrociliatus]|uniref:DNA primase large subunit n=1 Tax=Dimorphilus gyrociliatus TaxID=2664684 RepID=A0A7I8VQ14_9ANNE|nr:DgyrCDS6581 [Dimorphilus gyrociliatus]